MDQILHGSARTTAAVRRAIQHSQESLRALAKRHGINQKTVAKWKKRTATKDLPTGPKDAHSTTLKTLRGLTPYEYIVKSGQPSQKGLHSIRTIKCRD